MFLLQFQVLSSSARNLPEETKLVEARMKNQPFRRMDFSFVAGTWREMIWDDGKVKSIIIPVVGYIIYFFSGALPLQFAGLGGYIYILFNYIYIIIYIYIYITHIQCVYNCMYVNIYKHIYIYTYVAMKLCSGLEQWWSEHAMICC